jgi:RNA polymerase sigma factor (sigma-70 family)
MTKLIIAAAMPFLKNISTPSASDQELLLLYKSSGNLKVLGQLYQQYMDLVYAVCLKYLKEPETAKDAVMAIFEELASKLHKHEVEHFRGWLYTLARNHCLMQLRSPKHLKTTTFEEADVQFEDEVHLNAVFDKETGLNQLADCLETLPINQKKAVELFYLQEKCYKEIAEITGSDWNQVRSLIQNGRRNLKNCIESKTNHDGRR